MPLVSVDIGNSSIKLSIDHETGRDLKSLFEPSLSEQTPNGKSSKLSVLRIDKSLDIEDKFELLSEHFSFETDPCHWIVCSVDSVQTEQLRKWVKKDRVSESFHVITADEIPLVTIPDRNKIGRDRLVAAWVAFVGTGRSGPVIVVDAGTAVTIDVVNVVDGKATFMGGLIMPGTKTKFRALSDATDALPDLGSADFDAANDLKLGETLLGGSTESAIVRGVHQLQVFGLTGIVEQLQRQFVDAKVVFTGGDAKRKQTFFPSHWKYVANLALLGTSVIGQSRFESADAEQAEIGSLDVDSLRTNSKSSS